MTTTPGNLTASGTPARPCRSCKFGQVTGPAGIKRPCPSCHGTGRH